MRDLRIGSARRHHADAQADVLVEAGYDGFGRAHEQVVFGHEFCGTIADWGPGTAKKQATGTPVVALPLIRKPNGMQAIGLSASAHGGYAEQVVVEEAFMMPLPNGLAPEVGVLTEPMAVGLHAVNRSEIAKKDAAVVIGCGPVGLAVICMLKARDRHDRRQRLLTRPPPHSQPHAVPTSSSTRLPTRPTTPSATAATPPRWPPQPAPVSKR
ncbi:MAG: hypothetical protein WKF58_00890 [Ilumatobacteraceae bacterium]